MGFCPIVRFTMSKRNLISGLLLAAVGLLLLIIPNKIVQVLIIVLGAEAIVNGIFSIITTRTLIEDPAFRFSILIRGVAGIIIGTLAIALPLIVADTMWMIMVYVLAVYLLAAAVIEMYALALLRHTDIDRKQYYLEALVSIIVAVILILIPRQIGGFILRILGLAILIVGAVYIYISLRERKIEKVVIESVVVEDEPENTNGGN